MNERGFRYEQKYLISLQTAVLLQSRLAAFMAVDPHAVNGRYHIRSLYFDDTDHSAFFSKLNGTDERSKFRIRQYDFCDDYVSLEKKEKIGCLTRKTAVRLDGRLARQLASDMNEPARCGISPHPLLDEFLMLRAAALLRPAVYVDYDRFPFVCAESRTRITIDANVSAGFTAMELFDRERLTLPVLPEGTAILEIKFDERLPAHLLVLMEDIPMQAQAVSKYCLCRDAI